MSGEAFLAERLAWMAARSAQRPVAVFDLDNTLFDTRPRTLAVARGFDAHRSSAWFVPLTLAAVRRDGRATAAQPLLGPPPEPVVEDFAAFWDDGFWRPEAFVHDTPIPAVVAWARAALAVGAEVRFLTGRVEALHEASADALARIGLPASPETLACKPGLGTRTAPWKCEVLARWALDAPLGWFVTEGRRDTAAVQEALPGAPCVLVDCSFEDEAIAVAPGTPLLARVF